MVYSFLRVLQNTGFVAGKMEDVEQEAGAARLPNGKIFASDGMLHLARTVRGGFPKWKMGTAGTKAHRGQARPGRAFAHSCTG